MPLGQVGELGNGWRLTVSGVQFDATKALLAADVANKAPPGGTQYVLVSVSATYLGAGGSHLNPASSFKAAGSSDGLYTTFNSNCGVLPRPNLDLEDPLVFRGGTITGYAACWRVPAREAANLALVYHPPFANKRIWFALR